MRRARGRFEAVSLVLLQLSVFDELREDVLDLPARQRRRIEVQQELVQVGAASFSLLDGPQNVFFADFVGSCVSFAAAPPFIDQSIDFTG